MKPPERNDCHPLRTLEANTGRSEVHGHVPGSEPRLSGWVGLLQKANGILTSKMDNFWTSLQRQCSGDELPRDIPSAGLSPNTLPTSGCRWHHAPLCESLPVPGARSSPTPPSRRVFLLTLEQCFSERYRQEEGK